MSAVWHAIEADIKARIEELRGKLEQSAPENVASIQGEIRGLRYVLNTPGRLSKDPSRQIGLSADTYQT